MKSLVSQHVVQMLFKHLIDAAKMQLFIVTFSVIAAIGYVLIGNGLYDEAIKHFSLLLQVCVCIHVTQYGSAKITFQLTFERCRNSFEAKQNTFLCVFWTFVLFDTGWPRAGQCHLRERDSLWEEKSAGKWQL